MTNPTIKLTQPVTVTLSPATIIACMNGMAELPYHTANPAIRELEAQIIAATQEPACASPSDSASPSFGAYQWNKRKAPSIGVEASNAVAPERKPE